MTTPTSREPEADSPEERRRFLETMDPAFINPLQLKALGEHLERERKREQELLEDKGE